MNSYSPPASFKGGRYVPKKVLGVGTYGKVFLCTDQLISIDVAIKVSQSNPAYQRSAMNEICALQKLSNNAESVRLLDVFEDNGHVCIVTELLDRNLFELLRDRGFSPLSISDIRKVSKRVLQALTALHGVGFMHCDIKPENIMLRKHPSGDRSMNKASTYIDKHASKLFMHEITQSNYINGGNNSYQNCAQDELVAFSLSSSSDSDENEVDFDHTFLIDFGAVRQFNENDYYDVQSLWYRAPEVLRGIPYTPKIDSWSMGCLLAELYSGKTLFPGENVEDQLSCIVQLAGYPSQTALTSDSNGKQLRLPEACVNHQTIALQLGNWIRNCRHSGLRLHRNSLEPQCYPQNLNLGTNRLPNTYNTSILSGTVNAESHIHNLSSSSEEALLIDLILRLLCLDEQYRLSCQEALQHPFLNGSLPNAYASFPFTSSPQQRATTAAFANSSSFQTPSLINQTTSPYSSFPPEGYLPPSLMTLIPLSDLNLYAHPSNVPPLHLGPTRLPSQMPPCRGSYAATEGLCPRADLLPAQHGRAPAPYVVLFPEPTPSPRGVYGVPVAAAGPGLHAPSGPTSSPGRYTPAGRPRGAPLPFRPAGALRRLVTHEGYPPAGGGHFLLGPCPAHSVAPRPATVVAFP